MTNQGENTRPPTCYLNTRKLAQATDKGNTNCKLTHIQKPIKNRRRTNQWTRRNRRPNQEDQIRKKEIKNTKTLLDHFKDLTKNKNMAKKT